MALPKVSQRLSTSSEALIFTDHTYPNSNFDKDIENFLVFRGEEEGQGTEAYFLTRSTTREASVLTRVDLGKDNEEATRAVLGYSKDGKFEPDASAQCFAMCWCPIVVYYVYIPRRRCCYCW